MRVGRGYQWISRVSINSQIFMVLPWDTGMEDETGGGGGMGRIEEKHEGG